MKSLLLIASMGLLFSQGLRAQEDEEAEENEAAVEKVEVPDASSERAAILNAWEKNKGSVRTTLPRRWLFLQEQAGVYGSPSPLNIDKISFESYGWFQLAEAEAIRLFIQMNPQQKMDETKPEDLPARLKRYAALAGAEGVVLKTAGENSSWAVYLHKKNMSTPVVNFVKGPDSFRAEVPATWLVTQLGYDAMVVGTEGDYLILAKLKPMKIGAQGLILKKSAAALVTDAEKEVGALLRVVHESDDYVLAKVSLSKSGRPKVPVGSKVLFDQP